ncbi:MAG: hypothetical protein ISR58_15670 [Anaerolineales bacterium]|nr:hypothetical protein [Chloroflexota bacterium]MBL6982611.1 hypothetical protein [Anaerolineales bacterium]
MYKVLHKSSGQEITILDSRWRAQVDYLKSLDKQDDLICPGCEQPVRVRAGKVYRWHFAHKHLQNCPFERESLLLLQTRAVLYKHLASKFGDENVAVEKKLDSPEFPRHIDCWVEKDDQCFAYWIFDQRMPPDERSNLKSCFGKLDSVVNWVLAAEMLRVDLIHSNRVHLTTTERAFINRTDYDLAWQTHITQLGGSLHYLDADCESFITYRNLELSHAPQLYAGKRIETKLSDMLVSLNNGEFVHPGEGEKLRQRQNEISTEKKMADQRLHQAAEFLRKISSKHPKSYSKKSASSTRGDNPRILDTSRPFAREGACKFCGTITSDWVTYNGKTKRCICRQCKDRTDQ